MTGKRIKRGGINGWRIRHLTAAECRLVGLILFSVPVLDRRGLLGGTDFGSDLVVEFSVRQDARVLSDETRVSF